MSVRSTGLALACCMGLVGCQPGLGHHIAAHDFAHAFTRREPHVIAALSTPSFRHAVWDRIDPEEFGPISSLMGHGTDADVVDTQFLEQRAIVQFRVRKSRQQFRLYALYQGRDWFVDDVLREVAPLQYVSMRRQAEAILAVRDFRRTLSEPRAAGLCRASTQALCSEGWARLEPALFDTMQPFLASLDSSDDDTVGDVFDSQAGGAAAPVRAECGELVFYLRAQDGRLVIDDISGKSWRATLRAALRQAATRREWRAP